MKEQPANSIEEKIAKTPGKTAFRPIQDFLSEEKVEVKPPRVPEAQVASWLKDHPGAVPCKVVTLLIGFPEKCLLPMPCLAMMQGEGYILVLNVDGTTHQFHDGEYKA